MKSSMHIEIFHNNLKFPACSRPYMKKLDLVRDAAICEDVMTMIKTLL